MLIEQPRGLEAVDILSAVLNRRSIIIIPSQSGVTGVVPVMGVDRRMQGGFVQGRWMMTQKDIHACEGNYDTD